jgi:hypothetical protein
MTSNTLIDMEKDFKVLLFNINNKLLNIFIGVNDMCACCIPFSGASSPDRFEQEIREILIHLEKNVPRLVVNIMMHFNASLVILIYIRYGI